MVPNTMSYQYQNQPFIPSQYVPVQQYPQQQQNYIPRLSGRIVGSDKEILPNEVAMDGSRSYFPSSDDAYVYVKYWDNSGKLQQKTYILQDSQPQIEFDLSKTIESIDKRLTRIEQSVKRPKKFDSPKGEVVK